MINPKAILILMIWSFALSACATTPSGPLETWTVVDRNTKKPIPSAWVTIEYWRDVGGPPHGASRCVRSKSLITDENGQFALDPGSSRDHRIPNAYKSGFMNPLGKAGDYELRETYLVPFEGNQQDAFFNRLHGARPSGCFDAKVDALEIVRRKRFLDEATPLADPKNEEHATTLRILRQAIERDENQGLGAK
jgi:hypothetical protein